jgi:hypothetical protein
VVAPHSNGQVTCPWSIIAPRSWAGDLTDGGGEDLLNAGDLPGYKGVGRKKAGHLLGGDLRAWKQAAHLGAAMGRCLERQVTWVRLSLTPC